MSLIPYRRKRNFKKTPEPSGSKARWNDALHFVVQKHAASHLHYDFRLEAEGVLKSWAVPKGVSLDPKVPRLAIEVEDHPLSYGDFEGIIPEGNYGAGKVIVWDNGEYYADKALSKQDNEKLVQKGLKDGHLRFFLNGQKLKGHFSLIKLRGKKNHWFLMKKADEYAYQHIPVPETSVKTGRALEDLAPKPAVSRAILDKINLKGAIKSAMPAGVGPMLATLADAPFDRPGWIFEAKWDGYRILSQIKDGTVHLYSRRNQDYTAHFEVIARQLKEFPFNLLLDGEVVIVNEKGISDFQLLQNYMRKKEGQIIYYVFDVLYIDKYAVHHLPLSRRKEILHAIVPNSGLVRLSDYVEEKGRAFYETARKNGLEGLIAKKLDSRYQFDRRVADWLKIKAVQEQEVIICGFTAPRGSRKLIGALILGMYQDGKLKYIGHTGTGFTEDDIKDIYKRLQTLIINQCPFEKRPKTNARPTWVEPKIIGRVKFQEWTDDGHMRQPVFLGLREDTSPQEVEREKIYSLRKLLKHTNGHKKTRATRPGNGVLVHTKAKLTNLDKVYWPEDGYTKGDMIKYYQRVAPFILPYLKDHPQSLHRHPDGIHSSGFYQKDIKDPVPGWIKLVKVESESKGETIHYIVCQDKDSLAYINNLGCIEMNPWNSRMDHQQYPDYLVLDFDPVEIAFSKVIEAVLMARKVLEKIKVKALCKTSGARGMHVYVPLKKKYTFEQAKDFAHLLCMVIHKKMPETTSLERSPQKRKGLIYLDYLQNKFAATMAAAYSLRPRPHAPVSTPLEWKEVTSRLDPVKYNIKTIFARLEKKGDLWKDVYGPGMDMPEAIKLLEKNYSF